MLKAIVSALVGLIGFFVSKAMFIIGGGITFIFLVAYVIQKLNQNDKIAIERIRVNKYYQILKNGKVHFANNDEDLKGLIRQYKFVTYTYRIVIYAVVSSIIYLMFNWSGFLWLGIIFGLFYIPGAIRNFTK